MPLLNDDLADHPGMWTAVVRERSRIVERHRNGLARRHITCVETLVRRSGRVYHRAVVFPGQRISHRDLGARWQEIVVAYLQRAIEDAVAADGGRRSNRLTDFHQRS